MSGTDDDGTRPGRAGSRKPRTATRVIDEVYERIARTPRVGERLREALALYARSQKWTAALYARHFGIGADAARRDLGKLVDMNVLACIEGRGRAQGGRDPDLYALTEFGARVLSRCPEPGRCRRIRAPQVAEGEPVLTRSGLHKYKRSRKAAQDAHDLYCTRFGEHYGLLEDPDWVMQQRVYFRVGGETRSLVPDFYYRGDDHLWAIEVEGTVERAAVRKKHYRYRQLAQCLLRQEGRGFDVHLTIVFTSREVRERAMEHHESAYGYSQRFYWLEWVDLHRALATGGDVEELDRICVGVHHQAVVDALQERVRRQQWALDRARERP